MAPIVRSAPEEVESPFRRRPLAERFWEKVDKSAGPDGCWLWKQKFCHAKDGRGQIRIATGVSEGRIEYAPRVALFLATGEWPTAQGNHACDNPPCVHVHPNHVYEGTQRQNVDESIERGRFTAGLKQRKLTLLEAEEIRERARSGETHVSLSKVFGVCRQTIGKIVHRQRYK